MKLEQLTELILRYPKRRAALVVLYEHDSGEYINIGIEDSGHKNWLVMAGLTERGGVEGFYRITPEGRAFVESQLWAWVSANYKNRVNEPTGGS